MTTRWWRAAVGSRPRLTTIARVLESGDDDDGPLAAAMLLREMLDYRHVRALLHRGGATHAIEGLVNDLWARGDMP